MEHNGRRYRVEGGRIAARIIDGEAIMIDLSSGRYYSLVGSGALVWALLERGHGIDATVDQVATHYGVARERVEADLDVLIGKLLAEGVVVEVADAGEPAPLEAGLVPEGEYATPALEAYDDMEDLLALDPPLPTLDDPAGNLDR